MGYLGLDQTEIKEDNLFKRLFWPSDHAGETDTLGQQGFWMCLIIAVFSLAALILQGHPLLGALTGVFFALGGVGVREHSQPAAILVAVAYILNGVLQVVFAGVPPGALQVLITLLLLANIRGTWIAAKWAATGNPDTMPERMSSTWSDKVVDQMPALVWPRGRYVFYVAAVLYVGLSVLGTVALAVRGGQMRQARPADAPGTTIEVSPPQ